MTGITKIERTARHRIEEIFSKKGIVNISDEEYNHLIKTCGALTKHDYIGHRKIRIKTGTVDEMCMQCFRGKIERCFCSYFSPEDQCDRCWE